MVSGVKKHPEMEALEARYPLEGIVMETPMGQRWKNRMDASDAYHRDYSNRFGWRENEEMLSGFAKLIEKYGTYVAIPYAVTQNWVADTYYRNPDPLIQDKGGNRDLSRILSDVGRAIHSEVDSERKMKDALTDQGVYGFGFVWASFRQEAYPVPVVDDIGNPILDGETGQPATELEETKQEILFKRVSPWRVRFDPKGRDWDLSDHKYVAILYERSLADFMRDPKLTEEDKRRLMGHRAAALASQTYGTPAVSYQQMTALQEDDPEHIPIYCWHIWSRTDKKVYDMPVGASFTFEPQPWAAEFADANLFPARYMAKNRETEDESGLHGFIGIPDLTLIRPHVGNINKSIALFNRANQHVINKYLSPAGALKDVAKQKLADGVTQFQVIEYDKDVWNAFPTAMQDKLTPKEILTLVPQGELKELHHLEGIRFELDMIAQIIGQGPADRGGQSQADTATEAYGMQRGLERRRSNAIHTNGKHYNFVTKLFFTILKARQTLPIRYQMTTRFNQQIWAEFNAETLKSLDLHFDYATGSSEARTREEEFALHERLAAVALPTLQAMGDTRTQLKIVGDLYRFLNVRGGEEYFEDQLVPIMQELLLLLRQVGDGVVSADDQRAAVAIPELISKAAQIVLGPQQLAEVEAAATGAATPAPEGQGSLPSAPTPGEANYDAGARGSAAAGMGGGMAN